MGNWVVEMQDRLNAAGDDWSQEEQSGRTIYKVPSLISNVNEKAYRPRVVSFGPYHHGEYNLKLMEPHKERALLRFIHRSRRTVQEVFNLVADMAQELKDSYDSLDSKWQNNTESFVQLMILDGCFMLELLHVFRYKNYYSKNDPIFSRHGRLHVMMFIRADMLILENQLPMSLLLKLDKLISENLLPTSLPLKLKLKHILQNVEVQGFPRALTLFLDCNSNESKVSRMSNSEIVKCLHVLDVYRKGLLLTHNEHGEGNYTKMGKCLHTLDDYCKRLLHTLEKPRNAPPHNIVRSAIELHEAGVRFMKSKSKSKSLQDITFKGGVLKLPNFIVDDNTESTFLNLIAFEHCHIPAGNDITTFISFMDRIVDDSRDIKFLSSKGIIENHIGSDKEAADLFNKMSKDVTFDLDSNLGKVYKQLVDYSNTSWHNWYANLRQTYFRSPWAIISVITVFLIFSLTVVQTIFTILN